MNTLVLFLVLAIAVVAAALPKMKTAAATCDSYTTEKTCNAGTTATDSCVWCKSAAVGSTCFTMTDAKSLPSSVFFCDFQATYLAAAVATSCDEYTSEKACMAGAFDGVNCSWCNSAAVGGTCLPEPDAKSLPSSVFQCEYQKVALTATACDPITTEKACMTATSGGENCSWCKSAAVGGTCFVESDAKSLPSSVFQCEYQKVALKATTCDVYTTESTCMTGSSSGENCAWCKSAAVGNTCFVESDAKSLPSSVFTCEYQTKAKAL